MILFFAQADHSSPESSGFMENDKKLAEIRHFENIFENFQNQKSEIFSAENRIF